MYDVQDPTVDSCTALNHTLGQLLLWSTRSHLSREKSEDFYVLRRRRISYLTVSLFSRFLFECIKGCSYGFLPVALLSSFFCFGSNTPHSVHMHDVELAHRVRSRPFRFSHGHSQIVFSSLSLVFLGRVKVRDGNNGDSTLFPQISPSLTTVFTCFSQKY